MKRLFHLLICASLSTFSIASRAAEVLITPDQDTLPQIKRLAPGDVGLFADTLPGQSYKPFYLSDKSGLPGAPITLRALNPGKAIIAGSTPTRVDTAGFLRCSYWTIEGLVFEGAQRNGVKYDLSDHITFRNCQFRFNGQSGMVAGGCNDGLIEGSDFYWNGGQHGCYVSKTCDGWTVRTSRFYCNPMAGLQFNNQGVPVGFITNVKVEDCSMWGNGRAGSSAINLIGVLNSVFQRNDINGDGGGIALSGGASGNLLFDNQITFKAEKGKQAITSTGDVTTTNTAVNNILRMGKSTVPAIQAFKAAVIVQSGNQVLPVATKSEVRPPIGEVLPP